MSHLPKKSAAIRSLQSVKPPGADVLNIHGTRTCLLPEVPEALLLPRCESQPVCRSLPSINYQVGQAWLGHLSPHPITSYSALIETNILSQLALGYFINRHPAKGMTLPASNLAKQFLPSSFPTLAPHPSDPAGAGTEYQGHCQDSKQVGEAKAGLLLSQKHHSLAWAPLPNSEGPHRGDVGKF